LLIAFSSQSLLLSGISWIAFEIALDVNFLKSLIIADILPSLVFGGYYKMNMVTHNYPAINH